MAALIEITVQPTGTETHHRCTVALDRVRYRLDLYTNAVDERWYLDLASDNGTSLVRGIALALGVDLLHPYRHLDIPPGYLFCTDKSGTGADPGLDSFRDGDAVLHYLEAT